MRNDWKGFMVEGLSIGINRKFRNALLAAFMVGASPVIVFAQDQNATESSADQIDKSILSSIAPYNADVRENILIASQHPEILTKLAEIHDQASQRFQETVRNFSQKKQKWFYNVSRYPDLMHTLATEPKGSSKEKIEGFVKTNDADLKEAAWKLYRQEHNDLVLIDTMNQNAERAFESLIGSLNESTQNAFYKLLDSPDVLSLLNEHMDLTERLGQKFQESPNDIRQALATEHDRLDAQNRDELATYKDNMAKDPQAMEDLRRASEQYAKETGYSYPAPVADTVINSYAYSPYSYWFGYPYWFGSPMWYPGMGFGSGLYFGFGGGSMIYGLPSFGFSSWFFGGAYRYYPHLYRSYNHVYRDNVVRNNVVGRGNTGFMRAANQHFNPTYSARSIYGGGNSSRSWSGNPNARGYSQPAQRQTYNRSYSPNVYRAPSGGMNRGGYGGGFGGGMSSRGGGFSGGGMRGGGGRR